MLPVVVFYERCLIKPILLLTVTVTCGKIPLTSLTIFPADLLVEFSDLAE
jgi:hypothetical protein